MGKSDKSSWKTLAGLSVMKLSRRTGELQHIPETSSKRLKSGARCSTADPHAPVMPEFTSCTHIFSSDPTSSSKRKTRDARAARVQETGARLRASAASVPPPPSSARRKERAEPSPAPLYTYKPRIELSKPSRSSTMHVYEPATHPHPFVQQPSPPPYVQNFHDHQNNAVYQAKRKATVALVPANAHAGFGPAYDAQAHTHSHTHLHPHDGLDFHAHAPGAPLVATVPLPGLGYSSSASASSSASPASSRGHSPATPWFGDDFESMPPGLQTPCVPAALQYAPQTQHQHRAFQHVQPQHVNEPHAPFVSQPQTEQPLFAHPHHYQQQPYQVPQVQFQPAAQPYAGAPLHHQQQFVVPTQQSPYYDAYTSQPNYNPYF